jgi:cytochrome oxidase assembly protein ShyY1
VYRFLLRPKWIAFTLGIALLVVIMVYLAFWQLRRLDEKKDLNLAVAERTTAPVGAIDDVLAEHPDAADAEWRPVLVTGEYERAGQILIRNRSLNGAAGSNVVTPLRLADGRFVVVERGFVPANASPGDAPAGPVTVEGYLRRTQRRGPGDPATGMLTTMNKVDVPRIDAQVDGDALPMYVQVVASRPDDLGVDLIPAPPPNEGPHLSYAVQWFLFSAAAIVGYVLAVRKTAAKRRLTGAGAATNSSAITAATERADAVPER